MESIYERIRRIRLEKRLTQAQLARLAGYTSASSVAYIEQGRTDLSLSKIIRFADALGVSPDYIITGDNNANLIPPQHAELISFLKDNANNLSKDDLETLLALAHRFVEDYKKL